MTAQQDSEIVEAFLQAVADMSQPEVARTAAGVSQDDVSRWRRGTWKRLSAKKRRALIAYLEQRGNGAGENEGGEAPDGREAIGFFLDTFRAGAGKDVGEDDGLRRRDYLRAAIRHAERKGWDPAPLLQELGRLVNEAEG